MIHTVANSFLFNGFYAMSFTIDLKLCQPVVDYFMHSCYRNTFFVHSYLHFWVVIKEFLTHNYGIRYSYLTDIIKYIVACVNYSYLIQIIIWFNESLSILCHVFHTDSLDSLFNGISTFMVYLIPKPSLWKNSNDIQPITGEIWGFIP